MTNSLVRCSTCKRHIYVSETSCPFCSRSSMSTSGSIAVALTTAASIALAGCANDAPKTDPSTNVAPEAHKAEPTQAAPNPTPAPTPAPMPVASGPEPTPAPSASTATAPTTPTTTPTTPAKDPNERAAPAYGLPRPTATIDKKPPAAAYGGPPRPPRTNLTSDPL